MRRFAIAALLLGAAAHAQTTVSYTEDTSDFLNPERGFYTAVDLLSESDLSWVRTVDGHTLVQSYVRLDAYRNAPLPASLLSDLDDALGVARRDGVKVILRFAYNFGPPAPDAPLGRILQHIDQLAQTLQANADVIAVLQGGFIGAWGEWHSSPNGNTTPEARAAVLGALLDALPAERTVQLRYPADLIEQFPTPLAPGERFSGSDQARTGHHNDCFLSNDEDSGTYYPVSNLDGYYAYLDGATPGMIVGGETCALTPAEQRTDCATASGEMARFGWTYLNHDFWEPAVDRWRSEGCYDDIRLGLGHRYRLTEGTFPAGVASGATLTATLTVANGGFAGLRNPRGLELVLRPQDGGADVRLEASVGEDLRLAFPEGGEAATLTLSATVPADLALGTYALLLHLPDPLLTNRPAFSIRLANDGVWEPETGFNALGASVRVEGTVGTRSITLTSPAPEAVLVPGTRATLRAEATGDPPVSVTFYAGARRLGADPSAPFEIERRVPRFQGTYVLRAEATYADGQVAVSREVPVRVGTGAVALAPGDPAAWADEARMGVAPNPTASGATVTYRLAAGGEVHVTLLDARGREIRRLARGWRAAGTHSIQVPGGLPPGVYLVRLRTPAGVQTESLSVAR